MKKFHEIVTYSETDFGPYNQFDPKHDRADDNAQQLEREGHVVIRVGRAQMVIEQCESADEFPEGWGQNPLKITIYPDMNLSGTVTELYLHGGRYGLMDVMLRVSDKTLKALFFDAARVKRAGLSTKAQIQLLLDHIADQYGLADGGYWATTDEPHGAKRRKQDAQLRQSMTVIHEELARMMERLDALPDCADAPEYSADPGEILSEGPPEYPEGTQS